MKLSKQERSWILYDWANSAYSIIITTAIFPIFYTGIAKASISETQSIAYLGFGNSFYSLVIAFLSPILGTIADYKFRKKRFFTFFFTVGTGSTLALSLLSSGNWLSALLIYMASAIGFSGANLFYDSFLVDVSSEDRMDWISASGFAWGYVGGGVAFLLSLLLVLGYKVFGFESNLPAVRISFLITGLWWILFTIPFFKNVRQVHYIEPQPHAVRESFKRLWHTFKHIRGYKHVFVFLIAYFFYIDGVGTIIKMASPIALSLGIPESMLMIILLAIQIVAFPFALLYGRLAKRWTGRRMIIAGIGVYILVTFIAFLLHFIPSITMRIVVFWILSMLVASSQGGIQALSRSYYGKIIPKQKSAEFFGFYNIFGKFAAILGPFLVGLFTSIAGSTSVGVLSIVILFVTGGVILIKIKDVQPSRSEGS
jgi:UMF1 family MFS transporter